MRIKLLAVLVALSSFAFAQSPPPRRILRAVDNASVVRLSGSRSPRVASASDAGAVLPTMPLNGMRMVFSRTSDQQAALDQLLAEQQDPNSANYHKWLTPEEFGDRFGLAQADIDIVSAWLTSQGFTVDEVARSRTWIAFSGIAAQATAAFNAPIHNYVVGSSTHFAASTDITVPAALSGIVSGVTGLHNFAPRALNVKAQPHVTSSITGNHFLVPGDFATIYNVPSYTNGQVCSGSCLNGSGQTIAIVGQSQLSTDSNPGRTGSPGLNGQQYDLVTFRNLAGLPPVNLTVKLKGTNPGIVSGDAAEANLDVEWAGVAAPSAALIYYYESGSSGGGAFGALIDAVNDNLAQVISVSYGVCETQASNSDRTSITNAGIQAQLQGQAIIVASGDSGAADCDSTQPAKAGLSVDFPSSMPYSTAIGGTAFTGDSANSASPTTPTQYWAGSTDDIAPSAFSYIPETAWNDTSGTSISSTGGGASAWFPKPTWQVGTNVPADGARDIPDISFNASSSHDMTVICSQSSCVNGYRNTDTTYDVIGGTSVGAPAFSGILALINQAAGSKQGSPNSKLYSLAASSSTSWAFNDITTGNNTVTCSGGTGCSGGTMGYFAGTGYDLVTGLGSVDVTALIDAWTGNPNPHFVVLPASRIATLTPNGSSTIAVSIAAKEGFTGNVTLTCATASLTTATCNYDTSTVSTSGTVNLTIQAGSSQAAQSGTVTITATSGSLTQSVTVNVTVSSPDFAIAASNTSESVSQGGSTTDTITVTPSQGFTGSVSFSCTGTTGLTCTLGTNPVTISSTTAVTSILTVNASSSATTGSVTITATSGSSSHALQIPVTVATVTPDFTLTVASPVVSISSGGVITDNLTVAAVGSFNSNVALSCSVPSSLSTTTCTISPTTIAGGSGTALVTINGAVLSREMGSPFPFQHRGIGGLESLALALGVVFTGQSSRRRNWKRLLRNILLSIFLIALVLGLASCGGGSSGGSGGGGHQSINGNLTITATGGGITKTTTINVTVY